ncbi:MAG: DUF4369 domain-containing protein [Bacteroidaceae bacterium]|nr:DUF4369 domain-containing protein [Bacteroidaceae bacterium]
MKPFRFLILLLSAIAAALSSCSSGGGFEIDGHLLNMNQGTIYVYSSTGLIQNIDTINIMGGRFSYERSIEREGIFVLVFPNFTELPVFAEPGADVTLKGDAQKLKKISITGTEDNDQMTRFRTETYELPPPEAREKAEEVIRERAGSLQAQWLVDQYFLKVHHADYKKAYELTQLIHKAQPQSIATASILEKLERVKNMVSGGKLPKFSALDTTGKTVDNESLKGKNTIIYVHGTWDYGNEIDRNVKIRMQQNENKFNAIRVSLDASKVAADRDVKFQREKAPRVICDEMMFESKLMKTFSFSSCGDNLIIDKDGYIKARNVMPSELDKQLGL